MSKKVGLSSSKREIERSLEGRSQTGIQGITHGSAVNDSEVVATAQLAPVIKKFVVNWLNDRPLHVPQLNEMRNGRSFKVQFLGPYQWLSMKSGVCIRRISLIAKEDILYVSFKQADAILTALNLEHMLDTGEITPVRNPKWSQEKWIAYMKKRGCY